MRVLAHALFAAVLAGSLASRERSAKAPDDTAALGTLESAAISAARSQGLAFREDRANVTNRGRAMVFDVPKCSRPLLATWRLATFEDEAVAQSAPRQDYQKQYVYFDRTWERPNRWAVSMQRMRYGLLALIGRADYASSRFVLEVESPRDCPAAESVDWRPAWGRTDLSAAAATATAAGLPAVQ